MAKQIVITIHGVNPDRTWQPAVHDVLKPHFEPKGYAYRDYDTVVGPIRAVSNLSCLVISGISMLVSVDGIVSGNWWKAAIAAVVFCIFLLMGFLLGWWRRVASAKRLMRFISNEIPAGSPHVIAHSLGTYLIGKVIRKYIGVTFANVLLVSSVLPRNFPWARTIEERPRSVREIRNEFGTGDWVVKAVTYVRWFARDLGNAGDQGFETAPTLVHTSPSPVASCPSCNEAPVRVHNVPLRDYGHSEVFLGRRHARELWLPFLWGFPADELNEYLENMRIAAELMRDRRWNEAEKIIDQLFDTRFSWTHRMTLREAVRDLVRARSKLGLPLPSGLSAFQVVKEAKLMLPVVTEEALAESLRPNPNERVAWALHPNNAIARVVDTIVHA